MKKYIISLFANVSLKLINQQEVYAMSLEESYFLAKEIFKPNRWQFVGSGAQLLNKSIIKNKK